LSIIGSGMVYAAFRTPSILLSFEAANLKQGSGTVVYFDGSVQKKTEYSVKEQDDVVHLYVAELKAASVDTVTIYTPDGSSRFDIEKISLAGEKSKYSWDKQGNCLHHVSNAQSSLKESCDDIETKISVKPGSAVISGIPQQLKEIDPYPLSLIVLASAVLLAVSGLWFVAGMHKAGSSANPAFIAASRMMWLLLAWLYIYRMYVIHKYAVDAPYLDEWLFFVRDGLPQGLTWDWLTKFYVNHRIIPTKLLAWLNYEIFRLDFAKAIFINGILFGVLLCVLVKLKHSIVGRDAFPLFPAFMVFMMSTIAYQNDMWGFQSQFHIVLLFQVAALYYSFNYTRGFGSVLCSSLMSLMAMFSFSAGVIYAFIGLVTSTAYIARSVRDCQIEMKRGVSLLFVIWGIIGPAMLFWFQGFNLEPVEWSQKPVYPDSLKFWDSFMNHLSYGFGFSGEGILSGIICLVVVLLPVILMLYDHETRWQPATWRLLTAIAGTLAVLGAISMGRSDLIGKKIPRYAEIAYLLIPYAAMAWWFALRKFRIRTACLVVFWVCCMVSYREFWSLDMYRQFRQTGMETLMCSEHYFLTGIEDRACYDIPYELLGQARKMNVRFTSALPP
jgi:hypothetical protein